MATKSIRLSDGTDTLLPESATSATGYTKFADGTLICWGESTIAANSTNVTVTFPQKFINNYYGISVMGVYMNSRALTWAYTSQGQNSVVIYRGVSDVSYAQPIKWTVIGRWK